MGVEEFGEILGILAVVLGAARDEGFSEFLESDGIDGVERDPEIGLEEENESGGGLFQADSYARVGMFLSQVQEPVVQRLGGSADGLPLGFTRGGVNEVKIGFAIGTIQADDQVEGTSGVHHVSFVCFLNGG